MTKPFQAIVLAIAAATFSSAAVAGEVNGSTTNPKEDFSKGMSFCKFSGLNDDPTARSTASTDPAAGAELRHTSRSSTSIRRTSIRRRLQSEPQPAPARAVEPVARTHPRTAPAPGGVGSGGNISDISWPAPLAAPVKLFPGAARRSGAVPIHPQIWRIS
jgi:hypothetical protein